MGSSLAIWASVQEQGPSFFSTGEPRRGMGPPRKYMMCMEVRTYFGKIQITSCQPIDAATSGAVAAKQRQQVLPEAVLLGFLRPCHAASCAVKDPIRQALRKQHARLRQVTCEPNHDLLGSSCVVP